MFFSLSGYNVNQVWFAVIALAFTAALTELNNFMFFVDGVANLT